MTASGAGGLGGGDLVLRVDGVSKRFCREFRRSLRYGIWDIGCELIGRRRSLHRLRRGEFWALRDVSLTLRRSAAVGLIGANGAGKTTLLRLISGLIKPDGGSIRLRGRVAPLIQLGVSFNPVLTGRENVYVNMAVRGLSTREIRQRFDAVVDFAEVGEALDAPLQTYSSGMGARLGFACAVHSEPDILLIDEMLAVGDTRFRAKCYRKLAEMRERGAAFVMVSHDHLAIASVCDSVVYLARGRVVDAGAPEPVVRRYLEDLNAIDGRDAAGEMAYAPRPGGSGVAVAGLAIKDPDGGGLPWLVSGQPGSIWVRIRADRAVRRLGLAVAVREMAEGNPLVLSLDSADDQGAFDLDAGEHVIRLSLPRCVLRAGSYEMRVTARGEAYLEVLDHVEGFVFAVKPGPGGQTLFYQPRTWDVVRPARDAARVSARP